MATDISQSFLFPQFQRLPLEIRMLIWEAMICPRVIHIRLRHKPECMHIELKDGDENLALAKGLLDWAPPKCGCGYTTRCRDGENYARIHVHDQRNGRSRTETWPYIGFDTDEPAPATLFACHESRGVALKFYSYGFSTFGTIPQIPFCFELDTLFITTTSWRPEKKFGVNEIRTPDVNEGILAFLQPSELAKIRNLALSLGVMFVQENDWWDYGAEEFLPTILSKFGNVKDLAIVSMTCEHCAFGRLSFIDRIDRRRKRYKQYLAAYDRAPDPNSPPAAFTEFFEDLTFKRAMTDLKLEIPSIEYKILTRTKEGLKVEALKETIEARSICQRSFPGSVDSCNVWWLAGSP